MQSTGAPPMHVLFGALLVIGGAAQLVEAFRHKGWKSTLWHVLMVAAVPATNLWWGAASGPYNATSNPTGTVATRQNLLAISAIAEEHDQHRGNSHRTVTAKGGNQPGSSLEFQVQWSGRTAAGFSHPNIVPIHHLGTTADGHALVAMREVRGLTLTRAVLDGVPGDPNDDPNLSVTSGLEGARSNAPPLAEETCPSTRSW